MEKADFNVSSMNHNDIIAAVTPVLKVLQSQQAIVVIGDMGSHAMLYLFDSTGGEWRLVEGMPANIGKNGMGKTKEGDQKSPAGIFSLGVAFGNAPQPEGTKYPYHKLTKEDFWVDDSRSKDYNRWVKYQDGQPKDWESAEFLWQETVCYQYAVIIDYNPDREPGKGSAIFLHVWRNEDSPTQGCTAVSKENMVRILKWLDSDKKPVILQGTFTDIVELTGEQAGIIR